MRQFIALLTIILCANLSVAQDYPSDFQKYHQKGDTLKQWEVLTKWEKTDPKNAELFTSYFNYYYQTARKEGISMSTDKPKGDGFVIQDSLGQTVGYLGSHTHFDKKTIQKGFEKINKGIELYPNRLDMRYGKIHVYGQIEDWESFTNEIISTIQYSEKNKNEWTWTNNEIVEDGVNFMLSSIQDYQLQLFYTEDDELLKNMRSIAQEILKLYPNHIESLSNISVTYLLTGDYKNGIETLLRAEKIDPKDVVIIANIAHGYKLSGNKEMSIKYYEKMIEHGNEDEKSFARQQIFMLKE